MTTSVHTNAAALIALQNLNATSEKLTLTQNRVSTGLKVAGAKDNAAVYAIAQNQRAQSSSLDAVKASLDRATSIGDVSLAAGQSISDLLSQIRQKVLGAADPSASPATRAAYNDEYQSLLQAVNQFAAGATFDGANILNGSTTADLDFLADSDNTSVVSLTPQNLTTGAAGLNIGGNLLTAAAADAALVAIDLALPQATAALSAIGAQAKLIENHNIFVSKLQDSLETGIGNLVDADLAKESARLQALQVQQQLGVQALSIANSAPQVLLSLFRS